MRVEPGQLRRWTYKHSPLPVDWEDKTFLIVAEIPRWVDPDGVRHSSWSFIIDGRVETHWRDEDIERMSEVVEHHS